MNIPVAVIRLLVVAHLAFQFWIVFYQKQLPLTDAVAKFMQLVFMAVLCYTSFVRHRSDHVSLQKRAIFYAFLTWILRYYVNLFSNGLADMMSLAVVWLFVRSQTHVLNVKQRSQQRFDLSFYVFETMLLVTGLAATVQPGVVPNTAHTIIFTSSHLLYIVIVLFMYARAVVISKDPTIKARFVLLMLAATLYVGLFLSDFIWRSSAPGGVIGWSVLVKEFFGLLGMLSLFIAFNMSDRTRSLVIQWHRMYKGHTQQRLISLVLQISEAVSREEDHILPSLAKRVAKRLSVTDAERRVVQQAAAILAIIHRHDLPELRQQWQPPTALEPCKSDQKTTRTQSPFEDRLQELERVQVVLDSLDLPYEVNRDSSPVETEILRAVYSYVLSGNLASIQSMRGVEYAPQVIDALVEEVSTNSLSKTSTL